MIKLLRLMVMGLLASLFLSACQNTFQPQKVDRLEIGTVYQSDGEFKLVEGKRFVRMINESYFDSEEKLKEFRTDNEDFTFYPNIYFAEGTYEKVGDDYQLKILKSVKVEFKNVANIRKYKFSPKPQQNFIVCLFLLHIFRILSIIRINYFIGISIIIRLIM